MVRFAFLVLAASLLPIVSAAAETPDKKPFLAGAATANITPWLGDGYGELVKTGIGKTCPLKNPFLRETAYSQMRGSNEKPPFPPGAPVP